MNCLKVWLKLHFVYLHNTEKETGSLQLCCDSCLLGTCFNVRISDLNNNNSKHIFLASQCLNFRGTKLSYQVCVQPRPLAVSMALPTFIGACCAAVNQYLSFAGPTAANPPINTVAASYFIALI